MGSDDRIGLIYSWDENWIGGTYYIQNLMNAIYEANSDAQFKVFTSAPQHIESLKSQRYFSNIEFEIFTELSWWQKVANKFFRMVRFKAPFAAESDDTPVVYPGPGGSFFYDIKHKLYWIPDLQDCYHPEFFERQELDNRASFREEIIFKKFPIVFSSQNAQNDFKNFYPEAQNKSFVLNFAVTPPNLSGINKEHLLLKYNISGRYFICCNQFWMHKNHKLLLDAFKEAKKQKENLQLILTGKESDRRNMDYVNNLMKQIEFVDGVISLGFIDRNDQLGLMKYSNAVVQPSRFEGWGTVVEDAKALGKHVILSDIPIHREQMKDNCTFFNPMDVKDLAECILELSDKDLEYATDYCVTFKSFGQNYLNILKKL